MALRPLRRAGRVFGFVAVTAAMLPAFAAREALTAKQERSKLRDAWVSRWADLLLRLFGIEVTLVEAEAAGQRETPRESLHPDLWSTVGERSQLRSGASARPRGRLVVSNHRSASDIGVLLRTFGGHMVSRSDLAAWPLIGAAARKVGTVFVDRASTTSGASAIRTMRDLLRAGETVLLFPEGTTFADDEVRPFAPGAFIAALRTDADVIPVGLAYARGSGAAFVGETFPQHLARMAAAPPTRVVVATGAPLRVARGHNSAALAKEAHDAVQRLVERARAACDG